MAAVDRKDLDDALGDVMDVVKQAVLQATGPLADRIEALEKRSTRGMHFCGTFSRASDYGRGAVVVVDGSGWVAIREVAPGEVPGVSDAWSLMARKGRDGKDGR